MLKITKIKDLEDGDILVKVEWNGKIFEVKVEEEDIYIGKEGIEVKVFGKWHDLIDTEEDENRDNLTDSQVNDYTRY